jgi:phospholipase D1/2
VAILAPGRTCWRITRADRLAFLVDGEAYFSAFRQAVLRAQRSVMIVGWDVDSRVRLVGDERPADGHPATLLAFLNSVLAQRPDLHVYVLGWDFSMIYTFEREMLPAYKFGWRGHRRLHFALDGNHAQWASHHQKLVIVDDRVAFAGGLDLTVRRWDTPAHAGHDRRRVDPAGVPYHPIHDLQMAVDGDTAASLGALARQRWLAATGDALPPLTARDGDPWPDVVPDLAPARVGIARTAADELRGTHVKEILALTRAAIASARRTIFIENQFLTSSAVEEALAARLGEATGPEVVLVLPRLESGWLEQSSMGILRARLLSRLRQADRHGRLHVYHPVVPDLAGGCMGVHSKLLIIDDRLLKLGSANMSNRSMGLDTECDLVLEADGEADQFTARAIAAFRTRLLAEHLGVAADLLDQQIAAHGLDGAIARLRGGPRSLEPLDGTTAPVLNLTKVLDGWVCDPDRPIAAQELIDEFVPDVSQSPAQRALLGLGAVLVALLTMAALWHLSPFVRWLGLEGLASGTWLRDHPAAPLWVLAMFVVGALVFFPAIVLVAATVLAFGFPVGVIYAWTAALVASAVSYLIGRFLPRKEVRGRWPTQTMWLRGQLRHRGFLAIPLARLVPVGNFAVMNVVAGSLRVPFPRFVFGNAVGLLPGVLVMSLFTNRIAAALRSPGIENVLALAVLVAAAIWALSWLGRRLVRGSARSLAAGASP